MKKFLQNISLKLRRFMYGRYGTDELFRALTILYLIIIIIASITGRFSRPAYYVFYSLSVLVIVFTFYRAFSKNISARNKENQKYLVILNKVRAYFNLQKDKFSQRKTHKFVKCSQCKKTLRLPKNKGKLKVNCPHCNNEFIINTGKKRL